MSRIIIVICILLVFDNDVILGRNVSRIVSCPCGQINEQVNYQLKNVCLKNINPLAFPLHNTTDFLWYYFTSDPFSEIKCDLVVNFINETPKRVICPGVLFPQPTIEIPYERLHNAQDDSIAILCSLTFGMIRDSSQILNRNLSIMDMTVQERTDFMVNISNRRFSESNEYYHINSTILRRQIYGLIIWVGSASRQHIMNDQQAILQDSLYHSTSSIIGWSIDETIFPCRINSTQCYNSDKNGNYMYSMPLTQLHDPRCNEGWACAQRRPLRALAHVLNLFHPHFIFLGNYLSPRPGQLSPRGFFLGGAGYLMGRGAIDRLVSYEVQEFPPPAPRGPRSPRQQASMLSLAREAKHAANIACPEGCILKKNDRDRDGNTMTRGHTPIAVRLVDLDHSLSRCLFYGFQSEAKGFPCDFQATKDDIRSRVPFMCGHIICTETRIYEILEKIIETKLFIDKASAFVTTRGGGILSAGQEQKYPRPYMGAGWNKGTRHVGCAVLRESEWGFVVRWHGREAVVIGFGVRREVLFGVTDVRAASGAPDEV
eukprot:gene11144-23289_t